MRNALLAAIAVVLAIPAAPSFAADFPVTAPKRVQAGKAVTVIARYGDVGTCRLTAGRATSPKAGSGNIVRFTFTVSKRAKPGRYTLTVRCGADRKLLRLAVTKAKGRRGTSKTLVQGKIKVRTARDLGNDTPPPQPTPPCCKLTPTPTPTPDPSAPGPGNSFRAVYALASDQTEKPGYVDGIVATIGEVNRWFATQTTGNVQPRWIREAGAPKVTVVTLARPAAAYEDVVDGYLRLREDLQAAAPVAAPTQKTVLFMDVVNPVGACGFTSAGLSFMTERPCNIDPREPAVWPAGATYITAHEMAHNFGAVPDCAPHSMRDGHVDDDPGDLLYGSGAPRDWDNLRLDPGHDDYYGTGTACGDIATSAFWTKTASPDS